MSVHGVALDHSGRALTRRETMTKELAERLFALRSPDGLRFGPFVVKADTSLVSLDVRFEGDHVWVTFDRPLKVDHVNGMIDRFTDGFIERLQFTADGSGFAYCDIRGPLGYRRPEKVPL